MLSKNMLSEDIFLLLVFEMSRCLKSLCGIANGTQSLGTRKSGF